MSSSATPVGGSASASLPPLALRSAPGPAPAPRSISPTAAPARKRTHSHSSNERSHPNGNAFSAPQAVPLNGGSGSPLLNGARLGAPGATGALRQWNSWQLVQEGHVDATQAEVLFSFFATHLSPLYPIVPRRLFLVSQFAYLATKEPLLLTTLIAISARLSPSGSAAQNSAIYESCSTWIRQAIIHLLDGLPKFRHVSTVEALLLLAEWPLAPFQKARLASEPTDAPPPDDALAGLLGPIEQYDGFCWSYVSMAVRLAQELGLNETDRYTLNADGLTHTWAEERLLRTWLYAFNADRHISLRRGRSAIIHNDFLTSTWWETISRLASLRTSEVRVAGEVWDDDIAQGLVAALMSTIQDRVFYNQQNVDPEQAGSSGRELWEESVEGLMSELEYIGANCKRHTNSSTVPGALFQIELEYASLYAHTLPIRALQTRLRRYKVPKTRLSDLPEGKWVVSGYNAAKAILTAAVQTLAPKNYLRLTTGRSLARVLFAALFLFKILALGVIPPGDGWHKLSTLLASTISALHRSRADSHHLAGALAGLLQKVPSLTRVPEAGKLSEAPRQGAQDRTEWMWEPREGSEEATGAIDGLIERLGGGKAAGVWGALESRERKA